MRHWGRGRLVGHNKSQQEYVTPLRAAEPHHRAPRATILGESEIHPRTLSAYHRPSRNPNSSTTRVQFSNEHDAFLCSAGSPHGPHTINDYKIAALGISGFLQSTPSSFESTSFAPWNLHGMVDGKRNSSREWAFDRLFFSLNKWLISSGHSRMLNGRLIQIVAFHDRAKREI